MKESIVHYDMGSFHDIPAMAEHMADMEGIQMWKYPEPDFYIAADGTNLTTAAWYIVTSIKGTFRNFGDDIFMGGDEYVYSEEA